ncbi:MAG: hypothetical protein IPI62_07820 [Bacteroidetes bacterium]|nr:hypothetical protein [Bacteroidota bacterium]
MKKLYLLLSLLFIYSSEGKAQLVNGDFENWVTDTQTGGLIPTVGVISMLLKYPFQ